MKDLKEEGSVKNLQIILLAILMVVVTIGLTPVSSTQAQVTTTDLVVQLISVPKHAKACEVFPVTFTITNLGPNPASDFFVSLVISDQFDIVGTLQAPVTLDVGETATVSVLLKVTAFVPGETRTARVLASATLESDPNPDNNFATQTIRLISKPVPSCSS